MSNVKIQEALPGWPRVGRTNQIPRAAADDRSWVGFPDHSAPETGGNESPSPASLLDLVEVRIEHSEDRPVPEPVGAAAR